MPKIEYVLAATVDGELVFLKGSQIPEVIEQSIGDAQAAVEKHLEDA